MSAGGQFDSRRRPATRAAPTFNGTLSSHANPLPPLTNLPSFSYGSPQTALPKPVNVRDTKVAMNDALEKADAAARARLEAAARERKLAEERAAQEARQAAQRDSWQPSVEPQTIGTKTPRRSARGRSEDVNTERKRSLRSQSVLSQAGSERGSDIENDGLEGESNFHEGEETNIEIHRIIQSARNPLHESSMLRSRNINVGMREPPTSDSLKHPRSAMKGSREEAFRSSSKPIRRSAKRNTAVEQIQPVNGEYDATFDEENQGIGLISRAASFLQSPPPSRQNDSSLPAVLELPSSREASVASKRSADDGPRTFAERAATPPDTADHSDIPTYSPSPLNSTTTHTPKSPSTNFSPKSSRSWFPKPFRAFRMKFWLADMKRNLTIFGYFLNGVFSPFLKYLLLGFAAFAIITMYFNFLQGQQPTYSAPILPPANSDELARRLTGLERNLELISLAHDNDRKSWDMISKGERDSKAQLEQQISSLRSALSKFSSLSDSFDRHTKTYQIYQQSTDTAISDINSRLANEDGAMRSELDAIRSALEKDNAQAYDRILAEAERLVKTAVSTAATSSKGDAASKYGDALIQAALHRYSATILQKPDYALKARGTLINPHLTSSTYDPLKRSGVLGSITKFLQTGPNEPVNVLMESTNVGDCWSFPRTSGQVSMLLSELVYPTDVTVDHVPRGISGDDTSAPRDIEFWVLVSDLVLREQVGKAAFGAIGSVTDNASTRNYLVNGWVRVATFTYDVMSAYPVQTFEIPIDLQMLGVQIEEVSFRILNNWGNPDYTSVYRLRVHGNPVNERRLSDGDLLVEEEIQAL